jgi:hypothetical protein
VILAIDPGPEQSAFVYYDIATRGVVQAMKLTNAHLVDALADNRWSACDELAIEMIASFGMPVGAEVFETCVWIGRFAQAWLSRPGRTPHTLVYRREVKLHLCGSMRAKDSNVRQALIDSFGGKDKAIGKKASPGPLFGIKADVWAALAVAVTYAARSSHARAA